MIAYFSFYKRFLACAIILVFEKYFLKFIFLFFQRSFFVYFVTLYFTLKNYFVSITRA